jgi:hypothetical protein
MRFFEFSGDEEGDRLIVVLRNYIGRAASKKTPAKLNWNGLNNILTSSGFEVSADYETFKAMYDGSPALQKMVKNFNDDGIELNVPGAPDEEPKGDGTQAPADSQAAVDQTAASAAAGQLAASQATPQA